MLNFYCFLIPAKFQEGMMKWPKACWTFRWNLYIELADWSSDRRDSHLDGHILRNQQFSILTQDSCMENKVMAIYNYPENWPCHKVFQRHHLAMGKVFVADTTLESSFKQNPTTVNKLDLDNSVHDSSVRRILSAVAPYFWRECWHMRENIQHFAFAERIVTMSKLTRYSW